MLTPRTVLYAAYLLLSHGIDLSEAVGLNNASSLEPRYPLEQSPADSGEFSFHQKRASCGNGSRCITGSCCGDKCANNCCGHDDGGGRLFFFLLSCFFGIGLLGRESRECVRPSCF